MKKTFAFFVTMGFVIFSLAGYVSADETIGYRNAKTLGMGDAKVAGGFGYNGFVDNPALLSRIGLLSFSIVNLPITMNKNLLNAIHVK